MPVYSAVMTMLPAETWKQILGESNEQILNSVSNKNLGDYTIKTTLND